MLPLPCLTLAPPNGCDLLDGFQSKAYSTHPYSVRKRNEKETMTAISNTMTMILKKKNAAVH